MYNLAKQELAKKLLGGSGAIMSMAVHSSGDHVLLGSQVTPGLRTLGASPMPQCCLVWHMCHKGMRGPWLPA